MQRKGTIQPNNTMANPKANNVDTFASLLPTTFMLRQMIIDSGAIGHIFSPQIYLLTTTMVFCHQSLYQIENTFILLSLALYL